MPRARRRRGEPIAQLVDNMLPRGAGTVREGEATLHTDIHEHEIVRRVARAGTRTRSATLALRTWRLRISRSCSSFCASSRVISRWYASDSSFMREISWRSRSSVPAREARPSWASTASTLPGAKGGRGGAAAHTHARLSEIKIGRNDPNCPPRTVVVQVQVARPPVQPPLHKLPLLDPPTPVRVQVRYGGGNVPWVHWDPQSGDKLPKLSCGSGGDANGATTPRVKP